MLLAKDIDKLTLEIAVEKVVNKERSTKEAQMMLNKGGVNFNANKVSMKNLTDLKIITKSKIRITTRLITGLNLENLKTIL